jgi:hypothetical protein
VAWRGGMAMAGSFLWIAGAYRHGAPRSLSR